MNMKAHEKVHSFATYQDLNCSPFVPRVKATILMLAGLGMSVTIIIANLTPQIKCLPNTCGVPDHGSGHHLLDVSK